MSNVIKVRYIVSMIEDGTTYYLKSWEGTDIEVTDDPNEAHKCKTLKFAKIAKQNIERVTKQKTNITIAV